MDCSCDFFKKNRNDIDTDSEQKFMAFKPPPHETSNLETFLL